MTSDRLLSAFGTADWTVERAERPFQGHFRVGRYHVRHKRFDGSMSPTITREIFESGDAVAVLPYDPVRDEVLLIEQFRVGPLARGGYPWVIEVIAGRIDTDEDAPTAVRREAMEEANCALGALEPVSALYPSPGIAAERLQVFCAAADLSTAGGVHGHAAEDEDIRVLVVPLVRALEAVAAGEINTAPAIVALLWLQGHRTRLKAAWKRA